MNKDITAGEVLRLAKSDKLSKIKLVSDGVNRTEVQISDLEGYPNDKFNISISKTDHRNHWVLREVGVEPVYRKENRV